MTFDLVHARALLARTPATLDALLRDLPEPFVHANEGTGTWSPFDVVGHLIHGEQTDWMARADLILRPGGPHRFAPFDRFAQEEASRGRTLDELLDTFATLRAENLLALDALALPDDALDREGLHPDFGTVTLRQLLSTWVVHDLGHLAQISRALAKVYRDEIGPWRAYLPVLDRR
ncbi:MAG: DinB family protein [Rhodothermales bacterium]